MTEVVTCIFCDAPVADDVERCPSCTAVIRRVCPSCGKINPVTVENCFACAKPLPPLPASPENPPPAGAMPEMPTSSGTSKVLRFAGVLAVIFGLVAAIQAREA
jgi:hypothetical protein